MKNIQFYKAKIAKRFSRNTSSQRGFTLVEFLLVMSIFAVLAGIATVNLLSFQRQSQLNATVDTFVADMKEQQMKAMSGDAGGDPSMENYGINLDAVNYQYILYKGTYSAADTSNFAVSVPRSVNISSTFPNSQINFEKGSGEIVGYASNSATITFQDSSNSDQKVIQLNKYGVITGVN